MSRILATSWGSGEILNSSIFHGFNPNARQISDTVWRLIPCLCAIERVDQCVASFGNDSKVSITIRSTTSSPMVRAAPGRGSSMSPSRRCSAKRLRHFDTVAGLQPTFTAICAPVSARSSHNRMMLQRDAKFCALECRRAQLCRCRRSVPVSVISTGGRPRLVVAFPSMLV